jgi:hypothetical protein
MIVLDVPVPVHAPVSERRLWRKWFRRGRDVLKRGTRCLVPNIPGRSTALMKRAYFPLLNSGEGKPVAMHLSFCVLFVEAEIPECPRDYDRFIFQQSR